MRPVVQQSALGAAQQPAPGAAALEGFEGQRGQRPFDPFNPRDRIVDEVANIGTLRDIELHQQVIIPAGRIKLGMDLAQRDFIGNAIGGAGALISRSIKKSDVVAYEELGAEAVRRLEVEDFPVTVINDMYGGDLYQDGKAEYRRD